MSRRIEINENLSWYKNVFDRKEMSFKMATIYGMVSCPRTGKEMLEPHMFLIDTGAAISILNKVFSSFIDADFKAVDYISIQYGRSIIKLP